MSLHWRQVQGGSWHLEVDDPSFVATLVDPECHAEIDGRRPLASVWRWDETAPKPWRARLKGQGRNRDYVTLERAKAETERRMSGNL